jgi:peptidoglycan hydrolase-like protein with peptidoglycan-binding domain
MVRRRIALALSPALAVIALMMAPAVPVEAAFTCHYTNDPNIRLTLPSVTGPQTISGQEFAGHYGGNTAVPSTSGVSAAGIEAQCILLKAGFNPGTIDGVFGPRSQSAARAFQQHANNFFGAELAVDGLPGSHTWPWLRWMAHFT